MRNSFSHVSINTVVLESRVENSPVSPFFLVLLRLLNSIDPLHTYLGLASLSLYPPSELWLGSNNLTKSSWKLHELDPLLNLRIETSSWARQKIRGNSWYIYIHQTHTITFITSWQTEIRLMLPNASRTSIEPSKPLALRNPRDANEELATVWTPNTS